MISYQPETVKGFQDFLPPVSLKRSEIKKLIERNFQRFGFLPVETPMLEFDELMRPEVPNSEDEAVSDRFRLRDRGGRNLGLRYEFTFQLARIFKQNPTIKLPFRRYQIGSNFRDEPTGTGRFREFTQCDIDIIGDSSIQADSECIAVFSSILKEMNIEYKIKVNNRKLLNSILESVKIKDKKNAMREIDKLDKLGEDAVKTNLKKYAGTESIITLFKLLDKDLEFFIKNLFEGAQEIKDLQELGNSYGFKIFFDPKITRGFSYYTGNIFEIQAGSSTIAGGGRYDKLVGKFLNREIPAVGISFGLERLTDLAEISSNTTSAVIISINEEKEAIKLAKKLRENNISCIPFFEKPSKALEYANSYGIKNAIFIGSDEKAKGKFKLRDLVSGKEQMLTETAIIKLLKT